MILQNPLGYKQASPRKGTQTVLWKAVVQKGLDFCIVNPQILWTQ